MKLWELWRIGESEWDQADGFVVRADNEDAARKLAANEPSNEGAQFWLDPKLSTCDELSADGDPEVIIKDHKGPDD